MAEGGQENAYENLNFEEEIYAKTFNPQDDFDDGAGQGNDEEAGGT